MSIQLKTIQKPGLTFVEGMRNKAKEHEKTSLKDDEILVLLKESVMDDVIRCRECGANLEPDGDSCGICGWKNLLKECGLI